MAMKSIYVPAQLHQELKLFAVQKGKTLKEMVTQLLQEGLEHERAAVVSEQERLWAEACQEMAEEHARFAEESVHYVAEVLDPDERLHISLALA
jgi:uncharacterized protein YbcC (UPF0753/DUF2309 family)